jgi:hypothetical protein
MEEEKKGVMEEDHRSCKTGKEDQANRKWMLIPTTHETKKKRGRG